MPVFLLHSTQRGLSFRLAIIGRGSLYTSTKVIEAFFIDFHGITRGAILALIKPPTNPITIFDPT